MKATDLIRMGLLSGGGAAPSEKGAYSGIAWQGTTEDIALVGNDVNYRDQKVLDETINISGTDNHIMVAMEGDVGSTPGLRRGIVVFRAAVGSLSAAGNHSWTKETLAGGDNEYILESDTGDWDTNIDCMMPFKLDVGWGALYGDFSAGKVGYATNSNENFIGSKFTKDGGNPIIDFSGSNQYLRHISRPYLINGVWTLVAEARNGAANNPGVTNRFIAKLECDEADFPGTPGDWTLTPIIEATDFGDHWFRYTQHMMPDLIKIDNNGSDRYLLGWQTSTQDGSIVNDTLGSGDGFTYAYSDDDCATFTVVASKRPLVPGVGRNGDWNQSAQEEFAWFWDGTNMHLYTNGYASGGAASALLIGHVTLSAGTFDDNYVSLFEDNFDSGSTIDTDKWTVTADVGGISLVQRRGKLAVISDGAQTTSLTKMLESKTAINSISREQKELSVEMLRSITTGGDVRVRIGNAAQTRYIELSNNSGSSTTIKATVVGFGTYSENLAIVGKRRMSITMFGVFVSFLEQIYNDPNGRLGCFVNATSNGGSLSDKAKALTAWPSEDLYVSIWASNVSGTATETVLNDLIVTGGVSPVPDQYVISDVVTEEQEEAIFNLPNISAPKQALVESMISRLILHDGALTAQKYLRSMWRNWDGMWVKNLNDSGESFINIKTGVADTNNGVTQDSNGHTFDGASNIDTNFDLRNQRFYLTNKALYVFYIHTVGTFAGANRTFYATSDVTNQLRIYFANSVTSLRFRINSGSSNDFTVAGAPVSDLLLAVSRENGQSTGGTSGKLWKNGVAQTVTGGADSTNTPNAELIEGSDGAVANPLPNGTILGIRILGSPNGFDAALCNTILRATVLS